ncbi:hypothetical protein ABT061_42865 [Streptosporangium sp. NPDC002544]|uniref:hypothetical protein n=1 Tax=Streptosporangium sp. NPDC002544 TaxID=3154538 RepID=UPI0033273E0D
MDGMLDDFPAKGSPVVHTASPPWRERSARREHRVPVCAERDVVTDAIDAAAVGVLYR